MEQLQLGDKLKQKIQGFDSNDSDDQGSGNNTDDCILGDGMKKLDELQKDVEENTSKTTENLCRKVFKNQNISQEDTPATKVEPARRVFTVTGANINTNNDSDNHVSEDEYQLKSTGPLSISGIFKVDSFDDIVEETVGFKADINQNIVKQKPLSVQKNLNKIFEGDESNFVKRSITSTQHKKGQFKDE